MNQYGQIVGKIIGALFGWVFLFPLSYLIPRNQQRFVVIGRDHGKFLDNSKYCFIGLQLLAKGKRQIIFLSDYNEVHIALQAYGCQTGRLSGPLGWWQLLCCGTIITDNADWCDFGRFAAAHGARVVQLWHGIPLKRIELLVAQQIASSLPSFAAALFRGYRHFIGRHREVDIAVATSTVVADKALKPCISAEHWSVTGYPRNDILLDEQLRHNPLVSLYVDEQAMAMIRDAKATNRKIVLYVPTFRNHMNDPFAEGAIDLQAFTEFADTHDFLFLIKLHPFLCASAQAHTLSPRLLILPADSDIYPLMPETDIMITDYSSIYFDFLLLDRPVLFYCYDLEKYMHEDRGFLFNYDEMTPGPKIRTLQELKEQLLEISQGVDQWSEQRKHVREIVFDHVDSAAFSRLLVALGEE